MQLTFKTLQNTTFQIEIDPTDTVKALKEKIEKEKGVNDYPAVGQKLIYAGRILDDASVLSEHAIDEKKFIVIMVTKPKAAEVTPVGPADPTAQATPPLQLQLQHQPLHQQLEKNQLLAC